MVWTSLGAVTVTEEWQSFPIPVLGSETIQLLQSTPLARNYCIGYLSQYFDFPAPGSVSSRWRKFYSSPEPQIFDLQIPEDFEDQDFVVWTLRVKARYPFGAVPWLIEAKAWYPDPPNPSPDLDP